MTIREIHAQLAAKRATARRLDRRLDLTDRVAETWGHPDESHARNLCTLLRRSLMQLYTEMHALEARLPTPESLSDAAFRRLLALGLGIEAAEGERLRVYREAKDLGFKAA